MMTDQNDVQQRLLGFQNRRYVVERYTVSLGQLTMAVYGMKNDVPPVYITFRSVKYLRIVPYWENVPFVQATSDECKRLLDENDIEIVSDMPILYCAKLEKTIVQIICQSVFLSETMLD